MEQWKKVSLVLKQFPWAENVLWDCYANLIYERHLGGPVTQEEFPRDVQLAALRKWVNSQVTFFAPRPFENLSLNTKVYHSQFTLAGLRPIGMSVRSELTLWFQAFGEDHVRSVEADYDGTPGLYRAHHSALDLIHRGFQEEARDIVWLGLSCALDIRIETAKDEGVLGYDIYPFPDGWDPKSAGITV